MSEKPLTINVTAKKAGIGVETIRYYQRIGLINKPEKQLSFLVLVIHIRRYICGRTIRHIVCSWHELPCMSDYCKEKFTAG